VKHVISIFGFSSVMRRLEIKRLPSNIVLQRKWLLTTIPRHRKVPLFKLFVTFLNLDPVIN
jgi:hypothetical protein